MPRSTPSPDPFGLPLATQVADLLGAGGRVLDGWCSHWMVRKGDRFVHERLGSEPRDLFATSDRAAFIAWLAAQSPQSLRDAARGTSDDTPEIITREILTKAVAARVGVADPAPYGRALAEKVATALDAGKRVAYDHRDYCGMGLVKQAAGYVYGAFNDGAPEPVQTFATRKELVDWLAAQSDASLDGRDEGPFAWGNQRVTRARLVEVTG